MSWLRSISAFLGFGKKSYSAKKLNKQTSKVINFDKPENYLKSNKSYNIAKLDKTKNLLGRKIKKSEIPSVIQPPVKLTKFTKVTDGNLLKENESEQQNVGEEEMIEELSEYDEINFNSPTQKRQSVINNTDNQKEPVYATVNMLAKKQKQYSSVDLYNKKGELILSPPKPKPRNIAAPDLPEKTHEKDSEWKKQGNLTRQTPVEKDAKQEITKKIAVTKIIDRNLLKEKEFKQQNAVEEDIIKALSEEGELKPTPKPIPMPRRTQPTNKRDDIDRPNHEKQNTENSLPVDKNTKLERRNRGSG